VCDELKSNDPIDARWQPVAVVSLGEEEPPSLHWSPTGMVCEIVGGAACLAVMYWGDRAAAVAAGCVAMFSVVFWVAAVRLWNSRTNHKKP
jgi:peptidoglycan/LPS O-acetylase OafA/YrhL